MTRTTGNSSAPDFEAMLPFQALAAVCGPSAIRHGLSVTIVLGLGVVLAAQVMIVIRLLDRERAERGSYWVVNELYIVATVILVFGVESFALGLWRG